ncbi:SUKH-3 domain-containing protein [Allokutzneria albata]|uniref:SUKH-3 immunity protein n=1 Tax=Allokutzneria albata TaxID=211114 RepID=A0A1G9U862_ALLAB|nr:SUKH-3 domain-containing protein [Allokutzneria albata]SDM55725.1 SUKH-3 immunity protein [Allokutzneria albata]
MSSIDEWWPQRAIDLLTRAGWSPGRAVDVAGWRAELAEKGFVMHEAAEQVLTEFGGLLLEADGAGVRSGRCTVEVDPLYGASLRPWLDELGAKAGARDLYPLGEVDWGHAILAIDPDGVVFKVWGPGVTKVGKGRDALVRLTEGDY